MLRSSTLTVGSPSTPSGLPLVYLSTIACTCCSDSRFTLATLATCRLAYAGLMFGSSPDADAVTASAGILDGSTPSRLAMMSLRCWINFTSVSLSADRLEPPDADGSPGENGTMLPLLSLVTFGPLYGRLWKYLSFVGSFAAAGSVRSTPISEDPTAWPFTMTSDPLAWCCRPGTWLTPHTTSGYRMPVITVMASRTRSPAPLCLTRFI